MFVRESLLDLPVLHLNPGELVVARKPVLISTILGSCVSVCLHNPNGASAMCHAVMPIMNHYKQNPPFYYVDRSIEYMFKQLAGERFTIKLYGGANSLGCLKNEKAHSAFAVGPKNIVAARETIKKAGFAITFEQTGGDRGCRLLFNTGTGEIIYKKFA